MNIDLFSFLAGFFLAAIFCTIFITVSFERQKNRAKAFTKRFAVISEGLSSLKALSFRVSTQLRSLKNQTGDIPKENIPRAKGCVQSVIVIFESISEGMMPPTEEIALEALQGRSGSAEDRAYNDSVKFRDNIRWLRQELEKRGIENLYQADKLDL